MFFRGNNVLGLNKGGWGSGGLIETLDLGVLVGNCPPV